MVWKKNPNLIVEGELKKTRVWILGKKCDLGKDMKIRVYVLGEI